MLSRDTQNYHARQAWGRHCELNEGQTFLSSGASASRCASAGSMGSTRAPANEGHIAADVRLINAWQMACSQQLEATVRVAKILCLSNIFKYRSPICSV